MTTILSVNVNAVAFLRNRRNLPWPDLAGLSRAILDAGAGGLTVHPRPDERHIRRNDVDMLSAIVNEPGYKGREFNVEGYPDERFLSILEAVRPHQATLVPDTWDQPTSDHGWDIAKDRAILEPVIKRLAAQGMRVALFVDPDPAVARAAASVGAHRVEIFTGPYGGTFDSAAKSRHLDAIVATADAARDAGLGVNAGHDLTVDNLPPLLARAPHIAEVSIGHAIWADAFTFGAAQTVERFLAALQPAAAARLRRSGTMAG